MRLYLGSSRPASPPPELIALAGPGGRVAVVANAQDRARSRERRAAVAEELAFLAAGGLAAFELDLRRFYRRPERLPAALAGVDLLWVGGGNAFVLRDAMRRSSLDASLAARLSANSLAYAGWSAGACVCGPTLRGLELVDPPPPGLDPTWDGIALTDFSIVPHHRSGMPVSEEIEGVVAYLDAHGLPYRALRDGEAIVIDDQPPVSGNRGGALR